MSDNNTLDFSSDNNKYPPAPQRIARSSNNNNKSSNNASQQQKLATTRLQNLLPKADPISNGLKQTTQRRQDSVPSRSVSSRVTECSVVYAEAK